MARLPIPGSDDGKWGEILNSYLSQSLNPDGTIKSGAISKEDIGLGSVDNTADMDKPVSSAVQVALDAKLNASNFDSQVNALISNSSSEAYSTLSNNYEARLRGNGQPNGTVSAPVGSRYIDLAATAGAVEWIKVNGTGNTGWDVVYGDTDWCNLAQWDTTGAMLVGQLGSDFQPRSGFAGYVRVRRINKIVLLSVLNIAAAVDMPLNAGLLRVLVVGPTTVPGFKVTAVLNGGQNSSSGISALSARLDTTNIAPVSAYITKAYSTGEGIITNTIVQYQGFAEENWPQTLPNVSN